MHSAVVNYAGCCGKLCTLLGCEATDKQHTVYPRAIPPRWRAVKASTSKAEELDSIPAFPVGIFPLIPVTFKTGIPVDTLPDAWSLPGLVGPLSGRQVLSQCGSAYAFVSRSVSVIKLCTLLQPPHSKCLPAVGWLVACLTSQQQASVSQGRICSDNFTCCHTEIEVADQTFYLTQSQYTDTGPTSPSADPIMPGAWQGSHWSANFEVTGMTRPRKNPGASGIRTRDLPLSRRTP